MHDADLLFGRADDRHEAHPLSVSRHRDQFLRMSAPVHEASHAEERPADLAERLVAVPSAAPRLRTWSRLRALTIFVEPDGWHGTASSQRQPSPPLAAPENTCGSRRGSIHAAAVSPGNRRPPDVICQIRTPLPPEPPRADATASRLIVVS